MTWLTAVTNHFELTWPLVQAPMGGGPTTPRLVAAVSEAGGLGSIAGGYLSPAALGQEIAAVRALTDRPFAVNLFASEPARVDPDKLESALLAIAGYRRQLGLPPRPDVRTYAQDLDQQLEVVVAAAPRAVSFTFGLLAPDAVSALHRAGCTLIGTATTVAEAVVLEDAGVDMVCAQGAEAGAHRGTFLGDAAHALVGTMALVPQVCDAVSIPVIASGGIMDGRGFAAALALGAAAAQLGTAFLRCPEAGTAVPYRRALAAATDTSTALTSAVTGRMARGIENRLMRDLEGVDVPLYPVMNALTAEVRRTAAARDDPELMSLWCGQAAALGTELPAGELLRRIAKDAASLLGRLAGDAVS